MAILVIDTATPQQTLNFDLPWAAGYRACYVKLGGDNNPRYVSPYYVKEVDACRVRGYRVGHYWVPDFAQDPAGAADYFISKLRYRQPGDFYVLDNESYPGNDPDGTAPRTDSVMYSDEQAAAWIERLKSRLGIPGDQILVYYGLSDARNRRHDKVLATGANFIIAAYSYAPFTFAAPSNIPMDRIVGHQTGQVSFGGVITDVNTFKDNAFDYAKETDMSFTEEDRAILSSLAQRTNELTRAVAEVDDKVDSALLKIADVDGAVQAIEFPEFPNVPTAEQNAEAVRTKFTEVPLIRHEDWR